MNEIKNPAAFSAEDLKRRKRRSTVMALCLAALLVVIFITTVVKISAQIHGMSP